LPWVPIDKGDPAYTTIQITQFGRGLGRHSDNRTAVQNECLFVSSGLVPGLPRGRVWPSSRRASRSFVLASLRALHLDLRLH